MLEIRNLTCGYGAKAVIAAINFDVRSGDFFGVIGPNGSGKTTLLRALSREIPAMKGEIVLNGQNLLDIPQRDLAQIVTVVSQIVPFSDMTVEEFVLLGRIPYFQPMQFVESRKDYEMALESMTLTDTLRLKDKRITHLSGGERQLVQIARALAQEPKLLLLDEPTAHLDIAHQAIVMDLLKKLALNLNLTVVMVLHDLNLASEYCDRLLLIDQGEVHSLGRPEDVIQYQSIEKVYQTVVVVLKSPVSGKPHVMIVPEAKRG